MRTGVLIFLLAALGSAHAASHRPRFGFQHFGARYAGGYSIVAPTETLAGPAKIRIRTAPSGKSAKVRWSNTFYTPHGSYRITLRWNFLRNGAVVANTMDPRIYQAWGSGTFALDRNHPIPFSVAAASGIGRAEGKLRLVGGGTLSITVTLFDLPEGAVTYSFSGSRKR